MATKEKSKEKEPEKKETPTEKTQAAQKEDFKVRHLTDEETKTLMDDKTVPEGYTKVPTAVAVEEPPEEKKLEAPEKPEEKSEKKPETLASEAEKDDFFVKLEREIAKPEGKENLAEFSPREKAYFYRMRRDRKLRQQAEEDRDKALFREKKAKEEKKPEPEEDPFKGKEADDFLTVGEAREILSKVKTIPKEEQKPEDNGQANRDMQIRYLQMCEREAKQERKDFDAVMELADDLVADNPDALKEIGERTKAGENPAIAMYDVIKNHKDFETLYPAAEIRIKARKESADKKEIPGAPSSVPASPTPEDKAKEEKAKQAEKTLEENSNKPKTTGHASSREGKPAEEMSMEEISRMKDGEFAKLPRALRQRYLRMYGA